MSTNNGDDTTRDDDLAANLTAHALNQLHGDDLAAIQTHLAQQSTDDLDRDLREIRTLADALTAARNADPLPTQSPDLRHRLEQKLVGWAVPTTAKPTKPQPRSRRLAIAGWSIAASLLLAIILVPAVNSYRESTRRMQSSNRINNFGLGLQNYSDTYQSLPYGARVRGDGELPSPVEISGETNAAQFESYQRQLSNSLDAKDFSRAPETERSAASPNAADAPANPSQPTRLSTEKRTAARGQSPNVAEVEKLRAGLDTAPFPPAPVTNPTETYHDPQSPSKGFGARLATRNVRPPEQQLAEAQIAAAQSRSQNEAEVEFARAAIKVSKSELEFGEIERRAAVLEQENMRQLLRERSAQGYRASGEQYDPIHENTFLSPLQNPLSTFSIDVDTASYANVRRFLTSGRLPPPNSVRIEELVNYFRYDYPQPKGNDPFSVNMEVAECPWRLPGGEPGKQNHLLLRVGLKGKDVHRTERPQSNLVFLLDVSGSMADHNKLPLLKTAMQMLVRELGENDRVSIVTYAGEAGLRLAPTRGHEHAKIHATIESLQAGGSTNGSAGINLAYEQAAAYFIPGGANRVILCTDGDLNVGITSDDALVQLIKQKAKGGTFLTVLGFGEGNLQDAKMEKLADNGNGLYAYIDSVREARKVLVEQLTGSTITIAKDVKIQIEFNPQQIAAYRLLGYENRLLAAQDFNNDKKDAGEIGAGHTVTALYELVPAGATTSTPSTPPTIDPLKYQKSPTAPPNPESRTPSPSSPELLTLKLRYKQPDSDTSQLLEYPLADRGASFNSASPDFQFAASVASFGMILRNSQYRGSSTLAAVAETASAALGADPNGYRAEFLDLIHKAQSLQNR